MLEEEPCARIAVRQERSTNRDSDIYLFVIYYRGCNKSQKCALMLPPLGSTHHFKEGDGSHLTDNLLLLQQRKKMYASTQTK